MFLIWCFFGRNYEYEEHFTRTRDNYLLCIHRIQQPIKPNSGDTPIHKRGATIVDQMHAFPKTRRPSHYKGKPVVLLYHGLTLTSEVWISNIVEQRNLALYLVERGYDVWMGNARGNKYSQSHLTKNPKNDDFWEFSINEFAMLDMPDTIDVK